MLSCIKLGRSVATIMCQRENLPVRFVKLFLTLLNWSWLDYAAAIFLRLQVYFTPSKYKEKSEGCHAQNRK